MAVHGFSYGGFMSGWIVGHDHRFKAAIVGAMCANLHSMYGTSRTLARASARSTGEAPIPARGTSSSTTRPSPTRKTCRTPVLLLHGEGRTYAVPSSRASSTSSRSNASARRFEFVRFPKLPSPLPKDGPPQHDRRNTFRLLLDWLERYIGVGPA